MVSIEVTRLLRQWRKGDQGAAEDLAPFIYPELRRLAAAHVRRENGVQIQATELVHEVYLRLREQNHPHWENRHHFYSVASRLMRQVLVDQARQMQAAKRGSGGITIALEHSGAFTDAHALDLLRLEEALNELERVDPRKARVIEQYHFCGLKPEEIAEICGVSTITVRRDLRIASAWLKRWFRH
jgi:RNA polymerase sigma-70 factor, ECF subfamily